MSLIWWTISLAALVIWLITVVDLFRRHPDRKHFFAWLIIVLVLPFVGALLYWTLRKPSQAELDQQVAAQAEMRGHSPFDAGTRR